MGELKNLFFLNFVNYLIDFVHYHQFSVLNPDIDIVDLSGQSFFLSSSWQRMCKHWLINHFTDAKYLMVQCLNIFFLFAQV